MTDDKISLPKRFSKTSVHERYPDELAQATPGHTCCHQATFPCKAKKNWLEVSTYHEHVRMGRKQNTREWYHAIILGWSWTAAPNPLKVFKSWRIDANCISHCKDCSISTHQYPQLHLRPTFRNVKKNWAFISGVAAGLRRLRKVDANNGNASWFDKVWAGHLLTIEPAKPTLKWEIILMPGLFVHVIFRHV